MPKFAIETMRNAAALKLSDREKLVLSLIAMHADREGVAYPGLKHLAEIGGLERRRIQEVIPRLVSHGLIVVEEVGGKGKGKLNGYRLTPFSARNPGEDRALPSAQSSRRKPRTTLGADSGDPSARIEGSLGAALCAAPLKGSVPEGTGRRFLEPEGVVDGPSINDGIGTPVEGVHSVNREGVTPVTGPHNAPHRVVPPDDDDPDPLADLGEITDDDDQTDGLARGYQSWPAEERMSDLAYDDETEEEDDDDQPAAGPSPRVRDAFAALTRGGVQDFIRVATAPDDEDPNDPPGLW
jgi:hypothetical protein